MRHHAIRSSFSLRLILVHCALLLCLLAGGTAIGGGSTADEGEVVLQSQGTVSLAELDLLARPAGWQVSSAMKRYPTGRAKNLWRLKRTDATLGSSSDSLVSMLRASTKVRNVERNTRFRLSNGYRGDQSDIPIFDDQLTLSCMNGQAALDLVHARIAQQVSLGSGIRVAVLDGGFHLTHEAVAGRMLLGYDALDDDYEPEDAGNGTDDDGDGYVDKGVGHGTAVAGVVVAVAPGARIIPVRVLDDEGVGTAHALAIGIYYALDMGAKVINISASGPSSSSIVECALQEASQRGVLVVGTPGNGGADVVNYPGCSSHVIPVAGVTLQGQPDPESNFGRQIELGAPSVDVVAPHRSSPAAYARWPGTSFAAPFFSGGAALYLERNPGTTGAYAGQKLLNRLDPYTGLPRGFTNEYGGGVLDLEDGLVR
jgi:hypothetical protein